MDNKKRTYSNYNEPVIKFKKSKTCPESYDHLNCSNLCAKSKLLSDKILSNERQCMPKSSLDEISNQYVDKKISYQKTLNTKKINNLTGHDERNISTIKSTTNTYLPYSKTSINKNCKLEYDQRIISLLKHKIREWIIKMRKTKATDKLAKIKEAHQLNLKINDKLISKHEFLESEFLIEPLEFPSTSVQTKGEMLKLIGRPIFNQNMFSIIMPEQFGLPTMRYWESIQINNYCADESYLYNIPYLNEELAINGAKFYSELTKNYKGIHDNNQDNDEFRIVGYKIDKLSYFYMMKELPSNGHLLKDDDLFYQLITDLNEDQNILNKNSKENYLLSNDTNSISLIDYIFQAISARYPKIGTYNDIKTRYSILCDLRNKSPRKSVKQDPFNLKSISNLDDGNTIFVNREQILNNFKELFCKRCFRYDCLLHMPTKSEWSNNKILIINNNKKFDIEFKCTPCNRNCYFYQDHVQQALIKQPREQIENSQMKKISSKRRKRTALKESENNSSQNLQQILLKKNTSNSEINVSQDFSNKYDHFNNSFDELNSSSRCNCSDWTDSEKTLVRCLLDVFKNVNNFCCIAESMPTKCCLHIYKYTTNEIMVNEPDKNFLLYSNLNLIISNDNQINEYSNAKINRSVKRKSSNYFLSTTFKNQIKENDTNVFSYTPCYHPGQTCNEDCCCLRFMGFCEKYCNCSLDCNQRFKGCKCKAQCNTNQCSCFLGKRECDPDLCGKCGACNFEVQDSKCKNIFIQKGLKKHLLLAPSKVSGWGIFSKYHIQKGEFISEYCGEIISQKEAERRGKVYDEYKCSFLFNLDNDFSVDATRKGNKIRFANHSKIPNCDCKIITVNGEQRRIAVFAKQSIAAGEELFLDYRYGLREQLKYVPIEK